MSIQLTENFDQRKIEVGDIVDIRGNDYPWLVGCIVTEVSSISIKVSDKNSRAVEIFRHAIANSLSSRGRRYIMSEFIVFRMKP